MSVTLIIQKTDDGWWEVEVPDFDDTEFAKVYSRTLRGALDAAVPYITCVVYGL